MFTRFYLLSLLLCVLSTYSQAQKYVGLNIDNDLFFGIDRYYSSGIFLEYGLLYKKPNDSISKGGYISKHLTLGQEINTPSRRLTKDLNKMDYPYNGWLFLGYHQQNLQHLDFGYGWGIQLGTTGAKASLAKFFQNTYHIHILNLEPLTWAVSIPQAFHFNVNGTILWGKPLGGKLKWINLNYLQAGTFRVSAKTRFGFQLGNIPGLPFFGNRLELIQNGVSFFLGMELEYNLHDYSLSGSLIRENSPFNLQANDFRNKYQLGLVFVRMPWKARVLLNNISPYIETQRYKDHTFLNISLTYLF